MKPEAPHPGCKDPEGRQNSKVLVEYRHYIHRPQTTLFKRGYRHRTLDVTCNREARVVVQSTDDTAVAVQVDDQVHSAASPHPSTLSASWFSALSKTAHTICTGIGLTPATSAPASGKQECYGLRGRQRTSPTTSASPCDGWTLQATIGCIYLRRT